MGLHYLPLAGRSCRTLEITCRVTLPPCHTESAPLHRAMYLVYKSGSLLGYVSWVAMLIDLPYNESCLLTWLIPSFKYIQSDDCSGESSSTAGSDEEDESEDGEDEEEVPPPPEVIEKKPATYPRRSSDMPRGFSYAEGSRSNEESPDEDEYDDQLERRREKRRRQQSGGRVNGQSRRPPAAIVKKSPRFVSRESF